LSNELQVIEEVNPSPTVPRTLL